MGGKKPPPTEVSQGALSKDKKATRSKESTEKRERRICIHPAHSGKSGQLTRTNVFAGPVPKSPVPILCL